MGIDWTAVGLAIVTAFGTLWGLFFNARLAEKADKEDIEKAIDRYHHQVALEFKADMLRMHQENMRRLERIETAVTHRP